MSDSLQRVVEWDPHKDEINFQKHGIHFEEAATVFNDPFAVTRLDRIENGEERWQTVGALSSMVLVLVAHTTIIGDVEIIRIINARKLDRKERNQYEHG